MGELKKVRRWRVLDHAHEAFERVRASTSEHAYEQGKLDLREFLTEYFNTDSGCRRELGPSISPLGLTGSGGRVLKVRWALPGQGKRGGLRIVAVAYCDRELVKLAGAWVRKDDPSQKEVEAALEDVDDA